MGLVADAVTQVLELPPDRIEPPPPFGVASDSAFLAGMGRVDGRFVLLLDLPHVLSGVERGEAVRSEAADPASPASEPASKRISNLIASAALSVLLFLCAAPSQCQEPIKDNSFLIEEAYNQERGVVQHISTLSRPTTGGDWTFTFTQEWPLPDQRHQVSFTLPVQRLSDARISNTGVGDIALNYRYQALGIQGGSLALSPRVSLLMPSGRSSAGLGTGGTGVQLNLPASWALSPSFVGHFNAGLTFVHRARNADGDQADTKGSFAGGSLVWLARPRVNLLVETLWTRSGVVAGNGRASTEDSLLVSPGIRWSHDLPGGLQIVPGLAFSMGLGPSRGERALYLYLSFEHSFRARP
ncbi:MAG: chemotaxis protein CheW, partial [Vicinamibacteria bacterium]